MQHKLSNIFKAMQSHNFPWHFRHKFDKFIVFLQILFHVQPFFCVKLLPFFFMFKVLWDFLLINRLQKFLYK